MTDLINKQHFGVPFTVSQISAFIGNHGLTTGRDGRFQKGHIPANKGVKGCPPGSEKGWFKPGNSGTKTLPLGSERIANGYVEVKYSNRKGKPSRRWKSKQRFIWEKAHGRNVPKSHVVIFIDGDKNNFSPDNLRLISMKEHSVMNNLGLRSTNAGLTEAGILVADIKMAVAARKRGMKKRRFR
jgi:hypothetical protein